MGYLSAFSVAHRIHASFERVTGTNLGLTPWDFLWRPSWRQRVPLFRRASSPLSPVDDSTVRTGHLNIGMVIKACSRLRELPLRATSFTISVNTGMFWARNIPEDEFWLMSIEHLPERSTSRTRRKRRRRQRRGRRRRGNRSSYRGSRRAARTQSNLLKEFFSRLLLPALLVLSFPFSAISSLG